MARDDQIVFTSAAYVNTDTAESNAARRFETTALYLKDFIIKVSTYAQLFGDSSGQTYSVGVGETIGLSGIDISTLYFKNAVEGQNGKVDILGVRR